MVYATNHEAYRPLQNRFKELLGSRWGWGAGKIAVTIFDMPSGLIGIFFDFTSPNGKSKQWPTGHIAVPFEVSKIAEADPEAMIESALKQCADLVAGNDSGSIVNMQANNAPLGRAAAEREEEISGKPLVVESGPP